VARRGRRVVPALAALGALLFAGRWAATMLADRWWAQQISPAAESFTTAWHVLELTLEVGGILVACAWFVGHLLVVYRAVGSVQISRHVANLEIREALTRETLLAATIAGGIILGLLTGIGASRWAPGVALAWHGLSYEFSEPVLGHDLGLYVAQLPLWRLLHGFFLLLTVLGLLVCLGLYGVVGALRWVDGRPAINDHARAHLGWLLVALALALAWGYLLEPYELVAGLRGLPDRATVDLVALVSLALTGTALMVAVTSAVWAARARHALVAAGWLVLLVASLGGHYVLPAFYRDPGSPAIEPALTRQLEQLAFGLPPGHDSTADSLLRDSSPPHGATLWDARFARMVAADPGDTTMVSPSVLVAGGRRLPVWLAVRGGVPTVSALAADTVAATGEPLWYRLHDARAYPVRQELLRLVDDAIRPGAPEWLFEPRDRPGGVAVDSWVRRVALAWALQVGQFIGQLPEDARVNWRLDPVSRLGALLPVVEWGEPAARVLEDQLVWVCDGYVRSGTFPLVEPLPWREGSASAVRAGFVGVVFASSGETRLYLRPDADPLSSAWASIAGGMVRPAAELPPEVSSALPYPAELFVTQSRALERAPWDAGGLSGRPESGTMGEPDAPRVGWRSDLAGTRLLAVFERPIGRRVSAVLAGAMRNGTPELQLLRSDSLNALPAPRVLDAAWSRLPSFERLADSVRGAGVRGDSVSPSAFGVWRDAGRLNAYRTYVAPRAGGGAAVVWASVAQGDLRGTGRTLAAAWENLKGAAAPIPVAPPAASLDEARRWFRKAAEGAKRVDWAGFGRAFDALRHTLGADRESLPP